MSDPRPLRNERSILLCGKNVCAPGHQGSAYGLRRIYIPRTWVNKGMKEGRAATPRPWSYSHLPAAGVLLLVVDVDTHLTGVGVHS